MLSINFNPRSPCGERPVKFLNFWTPWKFQSTLPVWGATSRVFFSFLQDCISIHAPRVGSDSHRTRQAVWRDVFQSTLPVWGATATVEPLSLVAEFQSTLPVWGATFSQSSALNRSTFQSTLPVWGATGRPGQLPGLADDFNPRSPCGERRGLNCK